MATLPASLTRAVVGVVVAAIVVVGGYFAFFNGPADRSVKARFTAAVGIYPGTPVKILGVDVGTVTAVHPTGGYVEVTMTYSSTYKLPAQAGAVEVANSLVSDRYIQLAPVYHGGPVLADGALIPLAHTSAPAELDDIYAALDKLSVALGPKGANKGGQKTGALSALIDVAAANLKGNGAALGNSIAKMAASAQTLANGRNDLFGTVRNLQKFTQTLLASDQQVRLFNQQLAQVAGDLASERTDLGAALKDLALTLDSVGQFVKDNAGKLHTDIKGLESFTNVLVNEKASLNETLAVAPIALANIVHAYQPNLGVLATRGNLASLTGNLNLQQLTCSLLGKVVGNLGSALGGKIQSTCAAATKGLNLGGTPTSPVTIPTTGGSVPTPAGSIPTPAGTGLVGGTP